MIRRDIKSTAELTQLHPVLWSCRERTMEEPEIARRKHIRRTKSEEGSTQPKKWIALLFICFGLFCVTQALNVYLRIGMEKKKQKILEERDLLKEERDNLKIERNILKQKLQDINNHTSKGWVYFSGSLYLGSTTEQSWDKSRELCQERGADLIIITSTEEQEFARLIFHGRRWIGLSDQEEEGVWKWVDGSLVNTSFWQPGEPNDAKGIEDCGELKYYAGSQNWNDASCIDKHNCICEKIIKYE